ncbi:MAG: sigma-70 family RNA polymerase sigma factor [Myxococcota bacterium]
MEEELDRIYEAELDRVWLSLRRHGVPERHVEDAAHEVFMVLFRRFGSLDRTRPLGPYLSGIAARVASDVRKRASERREALGVEVERADPAQGPEERLDAERRRRLIHESLEDLGPEQREVFVMHELEEHPMPEIAAALEIKLNTAYSRLRLAREAFTKAVHRRSPELG